MDNLLYPTELALFIPKSGPDGGTRVAMPMLDDFEKALGVIYKAMDCVDMPRKPQLLSTMKQVPCAGLQLENAED